MKRATWALIVMLVGALMPSPARAGVIVIQPGTSATVIFDQAKVVGKGKPGAPSPAATAQAVFALDATARVLTVTFQNTSPANVNAALYAIDFGLPQRVVNRAVLSGEAAGLPAGVAWEGPTDAPSATAANGSSTFAATDAVRGLFGDFLNSANSLPAGFLSVGQGGTITLRIEYAATTQPFAATPLTIAPTAYFVAPASGGGQGTRQRLVAVGSEKRK